MSSDRTSSAPTPIRERLERLRAEGPSPAALARLNEASPAPDPAIIEAELDWKRACETAERASRIRTSGVPERIVRLADSGKLHGNECTRVVGEFLAQGERSMLFLAGPEGPGKTVAAGAPLLDRPGLFVKAADLVAVKFHDPARWNALLRAGLAVVDDAGTVADEKGWQAVALYEVLDHRYDACAPIIVTTNMTLPRFLEQYAAKDGGRLAARIREAGRFVEVSAESLRPKPRRKP